MPPTTPPCTVSRRVSCGMYLSSACASLAMGRVCSQILPGPVERRQKNSVAAEDHVLDAGNGRDLKRHTRLKCSDVAGMHSQSFAGLKISHDQFAGEFQPCGALSAEPSATGSRRRRKFPRPAIAESRRRSGFAEWRRESRDDESCIRVPARLPRARYGPGSLVAKASSPAAPKARYSVIKIEPPPATRLSTPNRPPPPPNWVCVVIWMELLIHESSPASEMMASLGSRANSRTGMVVPVMRLCMKISSLNRLTLTPLSEQQEAFEYSKRRMRRPHGGRQT